MYNQLLRLYTKAVGSGCITTDTIENPPIHNTNYNGLMQASIHTGYRVDLADRQIESPAHAC